MIEYYCASTGRNAGPAGAVIDRFIVRSVGPSKGRVRQDADWKANPA